MPPDPTELASLAASIAIDAGRLLLQGLVRARTSIETKTTGTDMVTEMDRASESLIARLLAERRPGDGLVAEEGTATRSSTGVEWVADPLDGTTNYLYGFPAFAVSLAARTDGTSVAAAIHDPVHGETFTAAKGHGAFCNDRPLRVGGPPTLDTALVGTGFSYDPARRAAQARRLVQVLPAVRDIRRAGAAALDLCWVALGRLDAYYEWGLAPWDWAGGTLVAEEAGALTGWLDDDTLVAAPPQLFEAFVALLESDAEADS